LEKIKKVIMEKNKLQQSEKALLVISGIGLIPIALSYGLFPEMTLPYLFDFSAENVNLKHIMRAVMGLYLAHAIFYFKGAFNLKYRKAAVFAVAVFMLGLASGRVLSILLDGTPHFLLLIYLGIEVSLGVIAVILIKKEASLNN
jgi:hypothetical protein